VLAPVTLLGVDAADAVVIESIAAAAAGATGIDLVIPDRRLALQRGVVVADLIAETSGLQIFIRSDVPLASGRHKRICASTGDRNGGRSIAPCVVDLGIDRIGVGPDAPELASYWPSANDQASAGPFMISTVGFDSAADAEVMALAFLAVMRGATAITTDRVRTVRRVVDTVAAVIEAKGAA
jgi:hypothetical protein